VCRSASATNLLPADESVGTVTTGRPACELQPAGKDRARVAPRWMRSATLDCIFWTIVEVDPSAPRG
jgi:hypothetical protein